MYKISYVMDGQATEFAFAFPFFQIADVRVAINGIVGGEQYNYTVVPNEDFSGGNIVFDEAPPADTKMDIFRQISLSRTIDYQPTCAIDSEYLNTDFNFLLSALQDFHIMIDGIYNCVKSKLGAGAVPELYCGISDVSNDSSNAY
ncbi:MAG: hypothetical protein IIV74_02440 [Alphaproteobacteria bacterium]|nr:hypothetical protein [Alphaproteobacteria bacterium]